LHVRRILLGIRDRAVVLGHHRGYFREFALALPLSLLIHFGFQGRNRLQSHFFVAITLTYKIVTLSISRVII
jgi:hypothetical protein